MRFAELSAIKTLSGELYFSSIVSKSTVSDEGCQKSWIACTFTTTNKTPESASAASAARFPISLMSIAAEKDRAIVRIIAYRGPASKPMPTWKIRYTKMGCARAITSHIRLRASAKNDRLRNARNISAPAPRTYRTTRGWVLSEKIIGLDRRANQSIAPSAPLVEAPLNDSDIVYALHTKDSCVREKRTIRYQYF